MNVALNRGDTSLKRLSQGAWWVRWAFGAVSMMFWCGIACGQSTGAMIASSASARSGVDSITGFWALRFDSRNVPKASLLPSVTRKEMEEHESGDQHTIRWCQYQGMPYMMESTAPLDILQGDTQVVVISETPSAGRHIYTDRTTRPSPDTFDATRNGFSIGKWDGGTLIVETDGFSDTGYTSIPGGGFRTQTSHLSERYQLVDGGKELEVTFTWTDPKVFAKPHTYAFRYYRVPRGLDAGESFCDSNDQERADFLTKPPLMVK